MPRILLTAIMTFIAIVIPVLCEAETYRVVTESSSLNVRESPSKNAKVVAALPPGCEVEVSSVDDGWAVVTFDDGVKGYAKSDFLEPVVSDDNAIDKDKSSFLSIGGIRSTILKLSKEANDSRTKYADSGTATIALIVFLIGYIVLFVMKYRNDDMSIWTFLLFVVCYLVSVGSYIVLLPTTACWLDDTWGYFISVALFGIILLPYFSFMRLFISTANDIGDVSSSFLKSYFFYITSVAAVIAAPCIIFDWGFYDWIIIGYVIVSVPIALWNAYKSMKYEGVGMGIVVGLSVFMVSVATFALLLAYATHSVVAVIAIAVIVFVIMLGGGRGESVEYPCEGYLKTSSGERIEGTFHSDMLFQAKYGGRYYHYTNGEWR